MLRSWGTTALAVGVGSIAASGAWSGGCSPTRPTELVPGALSQVQVPADLAGIKLEVFANGAMKFNNSYTVVNGTAFLPATLGIVSAGPAETTVAVVIAGYDPKGVAIAGGEFADPTRPIGDVGSAGGPRVKRGSVQTYVDQHTLFLPMSLSYSCWDTTCPGSATSGQTCKGGQCVDQQTDAKTLVDFTPSLIDGTQSCFSPPSCFNPAVTALVVDADKCLYDLPSGETPGAGVNVRLLYQDMQLVKNQATQAWQPQVVQTSEQEILNVEPYAPPGSPVEGYAIPDPNKPRRFQLAPGLCNLVKASVVPPSPPTTGNGPVLYHTVSAVQVSTTCPSKLPLLPICAAEQNQVTQTLDGGATTNVVCDQPITLVPAPSAVYMVVDDSSVMSGAFGSQGYATIMGLSLSNPLFKRTYVGFRFLDHLESDCTASSTPYASPALDFKPASVAQPGIAQLLLNPMAPDPGPDGGLPDGGFVPLFLEGAMRADVGAYRHLLDFSSGLNEPLGVGAVMFFINRVPDSRRPTTPDGGVIADGGLVDPQFEAGLPWGLDCYPALATGGGTDAKAALEEQIAAAAAKGTQSDFVILNNGIPGLDAVRGTPLKFFQGIQSDLEAQGVTAVQVLDATEPKTQASQVLATFASTATTLGTCLYELPSGVDENASLSFTIPIPVQGLNGVAPLPISIPHDATCTAATQFTADGWRIEGTHIRVCGSNPGLSCWKLRTTVEGVGAQVLRSAGDGGTANIPEVPVTVTMPCVDGGP